MPVATREIILPYPHLGQQRVRRESMRFNWLAAGRRWRKTTLAMAIAIEAALTGKQIIWGAPVYDQVRVAWAETQHAATGVARFNQSRMAAEFPSGGTITYRSLDNPDNVRGHTADGVVIDECASIKPDAWYQVLRPMLIDTNGWFWGIGTPKGHNWYWREFQGAAERLDSTAWNAPTLGVTIEDGELVRQPHPLENPNIPFAEMRDLFETTPEHAFQQELLASFVALGDRVVWERDWLAHSRYMLTDEAMEKSVIARWLSYDTALKDTKTAAYSACMVGELLPDYRLRLRFAWRDRLSFPRLMDHMEQDVQRWNADGKLRQFIIEDKASGISAYQTLMASGSDSLRHTLVAFNPTSSKDARFEQAGVWAKNGSLLLPEPSHDARWLHDLEGEIFEESEWADQRDSLAQLILWNEPMLAEGLRARRAA